MLRPGRLVMLGLIALIGYMGFYAIPGDNPSRAAFDPDFMAKQEVSLWQAAREHQEWGAYVSTALMQREQHRYTWFRAVQSSYYLSRATVSFVTMTNRFERTMEDLTEAAAIEKAYTKAEFDPAVAARAQLNWWVTNKKQDLGTTDDVASLMAEEYGIRYGIPPGHFHVAARYRAEASKIRDEAKVDPDWDTIRKLLAESYRAMRLAIEQGRPRRAAS
jgi:hypothetical protein